MHFSSDYRKNLYKNNLSQKFATIKIIIIFPNFKPNIITKICNNEFFIKKEKNIYEKIKERQRQYIYSENDILKLIEKNNFKIVEVLDFETFKNKRKNTYRILYILKL